MSEQDWGYQDAEDGGRDQHGSEGICQHAQLFSDLHPGHSQRELYRLEDARGQAIAQPVALATHLAVGQVLGERRPQ